MPGHDPYPYNTYSTYYGYPPPARGRWPPQSYRNNYYSTSYSYRGRGAGAAPTSSRGAYPPPSAHRKLVNNHSGNSASDSYVRSADGRKLVLRQFNNNTNHNNHNKGNSNTADDATSDNNDSTNNDDPPTSSSNVTTTNPTSSSAPAPATTASRLVRNKYGNLVSFEYAHKQKSKKRTPSAAAASRSNNNLCSFYQKTGKCRRGKRCRYSHDRNKLGICPRLLSNSCPFTAEACVLSHEKTPNRMPHCAYFPRCKAGSTCIYPHVDVGPNATVCRDFVKLGWCQDGLDCCKKHVWECPEFSEKGVCSTSGCKLPHVLRRKKAVVEDDDDDSEEEDNDHDKDDSLDDQAQPRNKKARINVDHDDDESNNDKDAIAANASYMTILVSDSESEDSDAEINKMLTNS